MVWLNRLPDSTCARVGRLPPHCWRRRRQAPPPVHPEQLPVLLPGPPRSPAHPIAVGGAHPPTPTPLQRCGSGPLLPRQQPRAAEQEVQPQVSEAYLKTLSEGTGNAAAAPGATWYSREVELPRVHHQYHLEGPQAYHHQDNNGYHYGCAQGPRVKGAAQPLPDFCKAVVKPTENVAAVVVWFAVGWGRGTVCPVGTTLWVKPAQRWRHVGGWSHARMRGGGLTAHPH